MNRINITIWVLLVCLMLMMLVGVFGVCWKAGVFGEDWNNLGQYLTSRDVVQGLLKHYRNRLEEIFAGGIALLIASVSLILFIVHNGPREEPKLTRKKLALILALIIINGTLTRLLLAWACLGNFDMQSYQIVSEIVLKGGNVYAETRRYVYSPVWFTILGFWGKINQLAPVLSFHFLVKSFLTGVDLLTLIFLLLIARREKMSLIKTSIFFYLNPVSFLLTGYHGQFENLAIFMVVVGIYSYLRLRDNPLRGRLLLWIFLTAGMIVKHNVFYELIIGLHYAVRRYWLKILLLLLSVVIFLSLFIPYWETGKEGIRNVFGYSGTKEHYGLVCLTSFNYSQLKYVFIAAMIAFPFFLKREDIISRCLLGFLFFLTFATGTSIQYFVMPIALGALRVSRGFMFYSLMGSLFILGSHNNVNIPIFEEFCWNIVWIGALYWFVIELKSKRPVKK